MIEIYILPIAISRYKFLYNYSGTSHFLRKLGLIDETDFAINLIKQPIAVTKKIRPSQDNYKS